jgi:hypothetical protein
LFGRAVVVVAVSVLAACASHVTSVIVARGEGMVDTMLPQDFHDRDPGLSALAARAAKLVGLSISRLS